MTPSAGRWRPRVGSATPTTAAGAPRRGWRHGGSCGARGIPCRGRRARHRRVRVSGDDAGWKEPRTRRNRPRPTRRGGRGRRARRPHRDRFERLTDRPARVNYCEHDPPTATHSTAGVCCCDCGHGHRCGVPRGVLGLSPMAAWGDWGANTPTGSGSWRCAAALDPHRHGWDVRGRRRSAATRPTGTPPTAASINQPSSADRHRAARSDRSAGSPRRHSDMAVRTVISRRALHPVVLGGT